MAEWFEEWFNTPEYLNVYKHRNEKDAEELSSLILKNINLSPGAEILDMACGSGRHSILFAQKGFKVTAVDLSQNLLKVAKKAAKKAGVLVNFIRSDLRTYYSNIHFDLILNLFTSFGYFEDDEDNYLIIKSVYEHLNERGSFVIDYFNTEYIRQHLVKYSEDKIKDELLVQKRQIVGKRIYKEIEIKKDGELSRFHESVRMYNPSELIDILEKNGFNIQRKFGDHQGNNFFEKTSPRLILIANK